MRSKTEFLPMRIRKIYNKNKNICFEELKFKEINFIAANYNWTTTYQL
jgi:hypothetical protein